MQSHAVFDLNLNRCCYYSYFVAGGTLSDICSRCAPAKGSELTTCLFCPLPERRVATLSPGPDCELELEVDGLECTVLCGLIW